MAIKDIRLRVGVVAAGTGEIGMTFCPGKKQVGALSGDWSRNLAEDLDVISKWGAAAVVSVITTAELHALKVPQLGREVEQRGLDWYHLPVDDGGVPDTEFEDSWTYAGHRLRSLLRKGSKILIHCKGGLGRTGTIAARLLVELGERPAAAIEKVRHARPHTIENSTQERYVYACTVSPTDEDYAERVLGCLLGGAVGDALGYAIEFEDWEAIQHHFGPSGITELELHGGAARVSDDTQMTLFTLEGLLRALKRNSAAQNTEIIDEIAAAYQDWLATQEGRRDWRPAGALFRDESLHKVRAPGNTVMRALRSRRPVEGQKGCGGVMRVAPLGLIPTWSPLRAFELAAQAAALTHGHPTSNLSSGALAAPACSAIQGQDLKTAAASWLELLQAKSHSKETVSSLKNALSVGPERIRAGQLYGVWQGISGLPHRWVRVLDVLPPMLSLVRDLLRLASCQASAADQLSRG